MSFDMEPILSWLGNYAGDCIYFIIAAAALVFLAIADKSSRGKVIFPLLIVAVLVLNPITYSIIGERIIYWRLFWLFPEHLVIALAAVKLTALFKNELVRMLIGAAAAIGIVAAGRNVYTNGSFTVTETPEKLTDGVAGIADIMLAIDKEPHVISREKYLNEIRQYSADIQLYYGRDVHNYISRAHTKEKRVYKQLESPNPDYDYVLKAAREDGYAFVAVWMSRPIDPVIAAKYGFGICGAGDSTTIYYCPALCTSPANSKEARRKVDGEKAWEDYCKGLRSTAVADSEGDIIIELRGSLVEDEEEEEEEYSLPDDISLDESDWFDDPDDISEYSEVFPEAPTAAPTEAPAPVVTDPVYPEVTTAPYVPTEAPAAPTAAPYVPTEAPAPPTAAPTEAPPAPTEAPAEPTAAPPTPTEEPPAPTEAPAEPTAAPPADDSSAAPVTTDENAE